MLVVATLIAFFLLLLLFRSHGLRLGWLYATIAWSALALGITEVLSLGYGLDDWKLFISWSAVSIILYWLFLSQKKKIGIFPQLGKITVSDFALFLPILLIAGITLFIAIWATPNTWDSMTYHLPRIEHWIKNSSIDFYATKCERQLFMSPFAEIAILQLRLLSNSDYFSNLIQWFAMIGSLIGVSLIAKEFKLNRRWQIISVLIAATLPEGILEASSTQNDYVVTFFIVSFVYFLLIAPKKKSLSNPIFLGLALGMAVLTKTTAYMFLSPFVLWYIFLIIKKQIKPRNLVIVFSLALLINLPHFNRQLSLYGTILGPEGSDYLVGSIKPQYLAVNAVKHVSMNLGTPYKKINNYVYLLVNDFSDMLGVNLHDQKITWVESEYYIHRLNADEALAGNFLHTLLIIFSMFYLWKHKINQGNAQRYLFFTLGSFVLAMTVLRWQPWSTRLQLPFFIVAAPLVALAFSRLKKPIAYFVVIILIITSFYWLMMNQAKELVGENSILFKTREEIMYARMPEIRSIHQGIIEYIVLNDFRNIGLRIYSDEWEYPLWTGLRHYYGDDFRIEYVDIDSQSSKLDNNFVPDVIICPSCENKIDLL